MSTPRTLHDRLHSAMERQLANEEKEMNAEIDAELAKMAEKSTPPEAKSWLGVKLREDRPTMDEHRFLREEISARDRAMELLRQEIERLRAENRLLRELLRVLI